MDIPADEFDVYDLAALAYLYKRIKETEVISEAHHIVIDEVLHGDLRVLEDVSLHGFAVHQQNQVVGIDLFPHGLVIDAAFAVPKALHELPGIQVNGFPQDADIAELHHGRAAGPGRVRHTADDHGGALRPPVSGGHIAAFSQAVLVIGIGHGGTPVYDDLVGGVLRDAAPADIEGFHFVQCLVPEDDPPEIGLSLGLLIALQQLLLHAESTGERD